MDNRKKKRNKQKNKQNPGKNTEMNTEVLNAEEEKKKTRDEITAKKDAEGKENVRAAQKGAGEKPADSKGKSDNTKEENKKDKIQKEGIKKENHTKESDKESVKKKVQPESVNKKTTTEISSEHMRGFAMNAAKILLPVAACAVIIAVIISYVGSQKSQTVDNPSPEVTSAVTLSDEPLAENAHTGVNELMRMFCTALADGDMDTVRALKDYNTDREIITYEKKSEFIERYDNINCYTKSGMEENSYFVYVTYDVKFKDIETEAPGLNAFYVYTSEDGSLKIDGDTEENIKAAFKVVTSQDDVVDLYNKIDVSYNEAIASDEALDQFMADLPGVIRESVGVALAQLESGDIPQTEEGEAPSTGAQETGESEEPPQNQVVNQIVRTTDTVNVRSSDSEEADKIGKAQTGMELRRIEDRVNGWSKVIFEDKEAFIKSDYLEVVANEETQAPSDPSSTAGPSEPSSTVAPTDPASTAVRITATTNVNVRNRPSQDSDKIGSAQAGTSYNVVEEQGEWYKIDYKGTTGYVKAEFFVK